MWAYAYEFHNNPFVSDAIFDSVSQDVWDNRHVKTGNVELDAFFAKEFTANTGMWVYLHPELDRVTAMYERVTKD